MIQFTSVRLLAERSPADALVLPFWKGESEPKSAFPLEDSFSRILEFPLGVRDFLGQEGELLCLYVEGQPEKRWILLGLGEEVRMGAETLRRCYGSLAKKSLAKRLRHLNVLVPQHPEMGEREWCGVAEGLLLPNYLIPSLKEKKKGELDEVLLEKVAWIAPQEGSVRAALKMSARSEGVYYARDLVNGSADEVTPQFLAERAKALAEEHSMIRTTILDKSGLEKERMGLLLAVGRGSCRDPVLIISEYRGNPHSDDRTLLVGKGVTYDTGGLNLKPTGSMETMKSDMAGAAVCLGTLLAAVRLELKVNLTLVIPATENAIDANSFKPGDVYKSYSGKTVEMTNSDAEGRLILADALAYAAANLNPTRLIDIATLTGAIDIALGSEASGVMGTDDTLVAALIASGEEVFERLWRMPLFDEYQARLKSDSADLKSWNGRSAGANVAACFLRQFVGSVPWAHLDIAATAYASEAKKYVPQYATGFGVRLMIQFLETLVPGVGKL